MSASASCYPDPTPFAACRFPLEAAAIWHLILGAAWEAQSTLWDRVQAHPVVGWLADVPFMEAILELHRVGLVVTRWDTAAGERIFRQSPTAAIPPFVPPTAATPDAPDLGTARHPDLARAVLLHGLRPYPQSERDLARRVSHCVGGLDLSEPRLRETLADLDELGFAAFDYDRRTYRRSPAR